MGSVQYTRTAIGRVCDASDMDTIVLRANPRSRGSVGRLRRSGRIPAVVYGHGVASRSIAVSASDFSRAHRASGESTLIDLQVDDAAAVKVLIKDVAHDVVRGDVLHVDFHQVNLSEEVDARIPIRCTGAAPAEKQGGIIVTQLDHLAVRALPTALVHEIVVDLRTIAAIDDAITVADLALPIGVTPLDSPDAIVVVAMPPREEVEEEPAVAAPTEGAPAAEGEAVAEGKTSEGAPAEKEKKGEKK